MYGAYGRYKVTFVSGIWYGQSDLCIRDIIEAKGPLYQGYILLRQIGLCVRANIETNGPMS